jgi:hypothetical protein
MRFLRADSIPPDFRHHEKKSLCLQILFVEPLAPADSQNTWNGDGVVKIQVQCYAGDKADERPIRFQLGGQIRIVGEVLDQWYGPNDLYFKVRADDGNLYILRKDTSSPEGSWTLESFREIKP